MALGVILILFIGAIFPTKTVEYQVEVPYEDIEYNTEKEPYEIQEAYEKQVPYESTETYVDTVPVEKDVPYEYCGPMSWLFGCETRYRTEIFNEEVEKERTVTKYKTVTDYRTVTKYRDVEKSRTIMRTKMETKTKKVNWIFGFEVPW